MNTLADSFTQARAAIAEAHTIAIVTHGRPDGDAIGSVGGLQHLLRQAGKAASGILFDPPGFRYDFLVQREPLLIWDDARARTALDEADLWVMVDTAAAAQVEPIAPLLSARRAKLLIVDHHRTHDIRGDIEVFDDSAAATALLITEFAESSGWTLTPTAAELLYVGLATDTGWFRFSNADARAYAAASRLIALSAAVAELYRRIFQCDPVERFRLFAAACNAMTLEAGGRLAVLEATQAMMARCGANASMTEDLVNEPLSVQTIEASVLLVEQPDARVRVNFRSKGGIDVARVAQQFGGGGHSLASGAKLAGPIDPARQAVVTAMSEALGPT